MGKEIDENTLLARERTSLANERTYLAWIRTGLASVGGGFAIIRFLSFENLTHQLLAQITGCVLVALGIGIFVLSYLDFNRKYKNLNVQKGYAGSIWTISAISSVLIVVSIVLLIIAFRFASINL